MICSTFYSRPPYFFEVRASSPEALREKIERLDASCRGGSLRKREAERQTAFEQRLAEITEKEVHATWRALNAPWYVRFWAWLTNG